MDITEKTLREIRVVSGLTIDRMAERLGITPRHFLRVLQGERRVTEQLQQKAISTFHLSKEKLALIEAVRREFWQEALHD